MDAAGVATTIVQYADRLLPDRLDEVGAGVLQSALADRGIAVRTRTRTTRLDADDSGAVTALEFQDGTFQRADVVLFTVGVRPRDELARNAGLGVHAQGGVIIDDRCVTSDPHILAIGEAARFDDRAVDSAAGAHSTAEVAAERACGGSDAVHGARSLSPPHHRRGRHRELRRAVGGFSGCGRRRHALPSRRCLPQAGPQRRCADSPRGHPHGRYERACRLSAGCRRTVTGRGRRGTGACGSGRGWDDPGLRPHRDVVARTPGSDPHRRIDHIHRVRGASWKGARLCALQSGCGSCALGAG
ncbi:FAD-dependent oxidoreductase [Microbacterium oxydans]|nr:FAD-dependent oxidoreductase [Microbacterium oxydans]